MIRNQNCVYCGIKIKKSQNADDGRSVEHMIPQIAVSKKRTNAQGDFHVCRKCNTEKSKIDELFGLVSRINSPGENGKEAVSKLAKMAGKGNKAILNMIANAQEAPGGFQIKLPFKGEDIYKYGVFLTKGEYFKKHNSILDKKDKIVLVSWGGENLISELMKQYRKTHDRDPFNDLTLNSGVENVNKECFIVLGKDGTEFLFFFNKAYSLVTKVVDNNEENRAKKRENKLCLIAGFSKGETNEYCV
ncbi:TPA: hypothetical protein P0E23_005104 [Vibrio harveyi]|nr:hypothetical protein [Vibrio harveyi]